MNLEFDSMLTKWNKMGKDLQFIFKCCLLYIALKQRNIEHNKIVKDEQFNKLTNNQNGNQENSGIAPSNLVNEYFNCIKNYYIAVMNQNKIKTRKDSKTQGKYLCFEGSPFNYVELKGLLYESCDVSKEQLEELNNFKVKEIKKISFSLRILDQISK